jgi:hypothetical protein
VFSLPFVFSRAKSGIPPDPIPVNGRYGHAVSSYVPPCIPPSFPLFEFDPGHLRPAAARRWLWHWDGRAGAPAQGVVLAWAADAASALVCTTEEVVGAADARFRAAHLALAGTFLPQPDRPAGAARIVQEMMRLREDDDAWSPIPGLVPAVAYAEATEQKSYTLAYTLFEGGAVFVATIGVPVDRLKVRIARA